MLLKTIAALALLPAVFFLPEGGSLWLCLPIYAGSFLLLAALAVLALWLLCQTVNTKVPQEHDDPFFRRVMYLYIEALVSIVLVRIHTKGMEKLPKDGRILLVCNHQHEADPGVLLHCFREKQLAFVSKKENESMFVVGKLMHRTMCQLLNRENDREALKTILKCIQLLKDDEVSICAFPEGGIKEVGKLSHFRSGVFKIAQKAQVPIVVCTVTNTADIIPNWLRLRHTDVTLELVDVIPPEALKGRTTVDISEQVYEMMLGSLGESFRPEG